MDRQVIVQPSGCVVDVAAVDRRLARSTQHISDAAHVFAAPCDLPGDDRASSVSATLIGRS